MKGLSILAAAVVAAVVCLTPFSATGVLAQAPVPRTVVIADPGGDVTITIRPQLNSTQADVDSIRDAYTNGVASSAKWKDRLIAAGRKHGNALITDVHKDDPAVGVADTDLATGNVRIDLGDIAAMKDFMIDGQGDINTIAAGLVSEILPHENEHETQAVGSGDENAAMSTENAVLTQLGKNYTRQAYCSCEKIAGKMVSILPWTIGTATVKLKVTDFFKARKDAGKFVEECCGVGGIWEAPDADALPLEATASGGSSSPPYAPIAGAAAGGALVLAAGGWCARRRWRAG